MSREVVSCVAAAGAAATATFMVAKMLYHSEVVTLRRQFVQSEDNVAQLVEEYGVQLQTKASMASELVELRDELTSARDREAVLEEQLTEVPRAPPASDHHLAPATTQSEEQRRAVQQQLDAVKARVESLQAQLVILQGALEQVAASGVLGTPPPSDASPEGLAEAAALEAQRLRGQVAQLEAQCRLRDVEAGQLRASLHEVQRRHDDALLQAAAAETARSRSQHPAGSLDALDTTTEELQLLRDEILVLKRQLAHRAQRGGRPRLARCDSDASDAASAVSSGSGRRVHRGIPGVSSAFAALHAQRSGAGSTSTVEDDSPTGLVSPAECADDDEHHGTSSNAHLLRRAVSMPKQQDNPIAAVRLRPTACPARSAPASLDPPTPVPSAEPAAVVADGPRGQSSRPPLARASSVDLPERSISVRTSLQTWEALAALSAQGNKGLVVPSPRKLYWAGYKGVRLHDDA